MTCMQCLSACHVRCVRAGCDCTVCHGRGRTLAPRIVMIYDEERDRMVRETPEPAQTLCVFKPKRAKSSKPKREINKGADFRGDPRLFDVNNAPELVLEVLKCLYDEIKAQDEGLVSV